MKFSLKAVGLAVSVVLLSACSDRVSVVDQKMAEIRRGPAKPVEPLPKPVVIKDFTYSAGSLRSPFLAPSLQSMQTQQSQESAVKPDVNRIKEPLEVYELAELVYMGRIFNDKGDVRGLVRLPDGFVREVQVGEYMGKNDGKILEITPTQINILEIVPDARVGFVHKQETLVTPN